jgi:RND family efflux transporter MFP subunit
MSTVTVSFSLPERASGLVAIGQAVSATTAAFPGQSFPGTISAIDSRVDPVTRSLAVQATLPNDANILKPGMALNVAMSFPGVTRPVVPSLAVQWDKAGSYVWKIVDATARRADVTIVGRRSGQVLVAGDRIAAGDHVVVEGLQRLREGSAVAEPGQGAGFGGPPGNRPPDNATAARPAGAT